MVSILIDDNCEQKRPRRVNKSVVKRIGHSEYEDIFLNNKCLRLSTNRTQSKIHKIETFEINKIYLLCFDDKIYILNNRYDGLALRY